MEEAINELTREERQKLFSDTAVKVYGLTL
jgi:hypothetical protein